MIRIPLQTYKASIQYVFVKSYHSLVFDNLVFVQNLRCVCCRFADRTIGGKVICLCTHWLYHWLIRHHILVDALQNRAKIQLIYNTEIQFIHNLMMVHMIWVIKRKVFGKQK